jgi:hypothetical protein
MFPTGGAKLPKVASAPTSVSSYANVASRVFFRSGGGRYSAALSPWFAAPERADPSTRSTSLFSSTRWTFRLLTLTNSNPKAFLSNSFDVLSICRLVPWFFIRLLPRSCCLRSQSLMPLLYSGSFQRLTFRTSWCDIVFVLSLAQYHSCTAGHLPAICSQFHPRFTISLGPNFSQDISLAPCHCCTTGQLPAGGSQLPSGSSIFSGQFLSPSASPYS